LCGKRWCGELLDDDDDSDDDEQGLNENEFV
jgi:hypothetical protein